MSPALYTLDILRLAASVAAFPALDAPEASVTRRSRTCGSRVNVDLAFDDAGRVAAVGLTVHACALGQAAAALLARSAPGKDAAALAGARDNLAAFLAGARDDPGDWPGIDALAAARPYPARHASIRLAFEAAAEAAAQIRAAA